VAARQIFEEIREVKQDNGNFFDKILIFFDVAKSNFIGIGFALILVGIFIFLALV